MKLLAAGPDGRCSLPSGGGERKVRTPQSSVPDNVRAPGFKPRVTESATENIPPGREAG
jgi:hypothetical protein